MEELAFKMLASADAEIMKYLKTMCEEPIKIVAGGLALLAFAFSMIWGYYKCIRIWCGLDREPFLPFLKDVAVKLAIFAIIGITTGATGEDFNSYVKEPLLETGRNLASELVNTVKFKGEGNCAISSTMANCPFLMVFMCKFLCRIFTKSKLSWLCIADH